MPLMGDADGDAEGDVLRQLMGQRHTEALRQQRPSHLGEEGQRTR